MGKKNYNSLQTPLAKAKNIGSAKTGAHEYNLHRLSFVLMIPIGVWVLVSIVALFHITDKYEIVTYLQMPVNAIFAIFLFLVAPVYFCHELQDVIKDYISCKYWRNLFLIKIKLFCFIISVIGIFAILNIYFKVS